MDNMTHSVRQSTTEAMTVEAQDTQVVARIGFAERWLHRARTQCAEGDVSGGLLTLALADAEVRYALEVGGWRPAAPDTAPSRRRRLGGVLAAAAAAVVGVIWVSLPGPGPTAAGAFDGPPVIRFASTTGTLLSVVPVPSMEPGPRPGVAVAGEQRPRNAIRTGVTRLPAPVTMPAAAPASTARAGPAAPPAAQPASASTAPSSSAGQLTAPAPVAGAPTPFVLSEADLIDMVLAASRALQGSGP